MYIHFIAAVSTLTASLQVWMAWVVDDPLKGRRLDGGYLSRACVSDVWLYGGEITRNIC
jgi:hypothetical protein